MMVGWVGLGPPRGTGENCDPDTFRGPRAPTCAPCFAFPSCRGCTGQDPAWPWAPCCSPWRLPLIEPTTPCQQSCPRHSHSLSAPLARSVPPHLGSAPPGAPWALLSLCTVRSGVSRPRGRQCGESLPSRLSMNCSSPDRFPSPRSVPACFSQGPGPSADSV